MRDDKLSDSFGFLTDDRQKAFRSAINSRNRDSEYESRSHVYSEFMDERGKAFTTRYWWIAYIREAFTDMDGVRCREVNGISGLELDEHYFVYFKKVSGPEDIPSESKTLARARYERLGQTIPPELLPEGEQLSMIAEFPELFLEEPPKSIPLRNLHPIVAGYCRDEGRIIALYFMDIDYSEEKGEFPVFELDLNVPVSSHRQVEQPSKPTLMFKSEDVDREKTA